MSTQKQSASLAHRLAETRDMEISDPKKHRGNHGSLGMLVGAGASKWAGLPLMDELYAQLERHIMACPRTVTDECKTAFKHISNAFSGNKDLKRVAAGRRLETMLEILTQIAEFDEVPAFGYLRNAGYIPRAKFLELKKRDVPEAAVSLIDEIKRFILDQCGEVYTAKAVCTWESCFGVCLQQFGSINVFTTNYDRVIETACEGIFGPESTHRFWDGFQGGKWSPDGQQEANGTEIRLMKLHGSVTWYRGEGGRICKYPALPEGDLIDGNDPILFPVPNKDFHSGIFLWAYRRFLDFLEDGTALIVIGYSFPDDQIKGPIIDAIMKGSMQVLIVDPHAQRLQSALIGQCLPRSGIRNPTAFIRSNPRDPLLPALRNRIRTCTARFPLKRARDGIEKFIRMS